MWGSLFQKQKGMNEEGKKGKRKRKKKRDGKKDHFSHWTKEMLNTVQFIKYPIDSVTSSGINSTSVIMATTVSESSKMFWIM